MIIFYVVHMITGVVAFVFDSSRFLGLVTPIVLFFVAFPIALLIKYQAFYGAANGYGYFEMYKSLELFFIIVGKSYGSLSLFVIFGFVYSFYL